MKRKRYSVNTSAPDDASNIWHSTAIGSDLGTPGTPGIGSAIINSQTQRNGHANGGGDHRPNKRRSPVRITESSGFPFFSMILQNNGFILTQPRNNTTIDAMVFRKNMEDWISERLKGDSDAKEEASKFIKDMKEYLTDKKNLMHAMTPTLHSEEIFVPSLLHSLLSVQSLQIKILEVLFPALVDVSYMCNDQDDVNYLNQILGQTKWLPELVDGEKFTDQVLEILEHATEKAKKEMIRILPDLIPEKYHPKIGEKLLKLLEDFSPLSSTLMETFSVIDISEDYLVQIRASSVENMTMFDPKDFPSFFAFLFKSEDQSILRDIISSLRDKFNLEIPGTDSETVAITQELVDKIRFCININEQIVPVWTKVVKEELAMDHAAFLSLDLIMLIIFLENYKIVEAPLKVLLSSEEITLNLFKEILTSVPTIVDIIFEPISKFLEKLLWSRDVKLYSVITKVLVELFCTVNDYNAQLIVVAFTSVLAHGNILCRDFVLDAFTTMAKRNIGKLLKFMPLIMGIMDYVIKFLPSQVRQIMKVLAQAAHVPDSRESTRFEAEFSIHLRKQLTSPNTEVKCVGVVGSVATIDQLIQQKAPDEKINTLVMLIWRSVERHEDSCWIFFDEMSTLTQSRKIPGDVIAKLKDLLCAKFLENWTMEEGEVKKREEEGVSGSSDLKLKLQMNANVELGQDALVVRFESKAMGMSPTVIPAHTRVLCAVENQISNGDLTDVDIIVGCPVLIPDPNLYDSQSYLKTCSMSQRTDLARYLVLCINFFREVISAFSFQHDIEIKIKLWVRLQNLVELQLKFVQFVVEWGTVLQYLPCAYMLEKSNRLPGSFGGEKKRGAKSKGKGGKKGKPSKSSTMVANSDDDDEDAIEEDSEVPGPSKKANETKKSKKGHSPKGNSVDFKDFGNDIHPQNVVPFYRRFNRNVFVMLNSKFVVIKKEIDYMELLSSVEESQAPEIILESVQVLHPQTLVLLLKDLNYQVENSQLDIIKDIALDFPTDFFGVLCDHLDSLYKTIKKTRVPSDLRSPIESAFHYLYTTIRNYLEKVVKEYDELFKKALETMKERAKRTDSEDDDDEKVATYLAGNPEAIHDPATAVEQLKVMKLVYDNVDGDMKSFMSAKIHKNTDLYLQRNWKIPSAVVQSLLKIWLTTSETPLAVLSTLTNSLISQDTEEDIPVTSEYKSCSSLNFHTWYRIIFEHLSLYISKNTKKLDNDIDGIVKSWDTAISILEVLINVINKLRKPSIIVPLLKNARTFLEAFIQNGIKLLPILWKRREDEQAKTIIRRLQGPTRKIQYICEHCKVEKNTNLMRFVPLVKKVLETLIFRVREVLASNGAASAFWLGLLKHRNLDGKVIDSQIPLMVDDSDDEVEDEHESEVEDAENNEDLFDEPSDTED